MIALIACLNVRWLSARKSSPDRNPPARRLSAHPSAPPHSKDGCRQGRGLNLQLIGPPVQKEPIRALLRLLCRGGGYGVMFDLHPSHLETRRTSARTSDTPATTTDPPSPSVPASTALL